LRPGGIQRGQEGSQMEMGAFTGALVAKGMASAIASEMGKDGSCRLLGAF
jgi:hypothetical protein